MPWGGKGKDGMCLLELIPERHCEPLLITHSIFPFFMRKGLWPAGMVVADFQDRFPGLYSGKMGSH